MHKVPTSSLEWCHMSIIAFHITGQSSDCSTVFFRLTSNKRQRSALLAPLWGESTCHQWQVDSPHKGPVMRKVFPCHDIIIVVVCCDVILVSFIHILYGCFTGTGAVSVSVKGPCRIQINLSHGSTTNCWCNWNDTQEKKAMCTVKGMIFVSWPSC